MNSKSYSTKTRKQLCSRVQRFSDNHNSFLRNTNENISVNSNNHNEKSKIKNDNNNNRNCDGCQDNSFKLLAERISRIENLVNDLARLTKEFNSSTNKIAMRQAKYLEGIDLSLCKLEDLQKIITFTTNSMTSNFKRKFCEDPEDSNHKILGTNIDPKKLRKSGKNQSNWLKPERKDSEYSESDSTKECKKPLIKKRKGSFDELLLSH
ncbi:hypothetical protein Glove_360g57 [Diversispora epigaea]|uniref:Uncharacterized protein n=1 Tax=Diversispora epigaea TaxID=1348612 RepID=A0A397HEA9_9GLOM|nr:hypothetical protein Glove_360g57 [Diversispora epigaea]